MRVGDLVEFKNNRFPEPYFIVYKIYRDDRVEVIFLVSEHGKIGAFNPKDLRLISESRRLGYL